MSDHHKIHAAVNRTLERDEFFRHQFLQGLVRGHRPVMRISGSAAVSREMLDHTVHSRRGKSLQFRRHHSRDRLRVRPERALSEHLIVRVGKDIRHRREIHIESECRKIAADRASRIVCILHIPARSYIAHIADVRHPEGIIAGDARDTAALFVHT